MPEEHEPAAPLPNPKMRGIPEFLRRKWLLTLLIGVVGFILLIVLLDVVIMPLYVKRGSVATVPQVVGMKTDAALQKLKDAGYDPVQYEVRFDDKAVEGTIIRETPEGGEETKPGRKVYLIISGGKEMATVPDLRGKSLRDAKMLLLKSNMSVGNVSYGYSDSAVNGTVFQQIPAPGTKTTASTQVAVVVSQGQLMGRVPVPSLTNLTLSQAIEKLKSMKLDIGKVNYQNGTPENAILDQYPPAGDLVNEGATVDVFVSRGGATPPGNSP
jgi:eukaryotic-like serine/threonine-protein kinase